MVIKSGITTPVDIVNHSQSESLFGLCPLLALIKGPSSRFGLVELMMIAHVVIFDRNDHVETHTSI